MNSAHLTEEEIQQFAVDSQNCKASITEHIALCPACRQQAEGYSLLFNAIKQQPEEQFDFDLAEIVMKQLPQKQANLSSERMIAIVTGAISLVAIITLVVIFKTTLTSLFTGMASLALYLVLVGVVIIAAGLVYDQYRTYRQKLYRLDFMDSLQH